MNLFLLMVFFYYISYIGKKTKQKRFFGPGGRPKPAIDEARDLLATTILAHVPVSK